VYIGVVCELLEHKVSDIGPRYFCLNRRVSSVELVTIDAGSGTIDEYCRPDDDPIQRALHDIAFLDFFVPEHITENEGEDNDLLK